MVSLGSRNLSELGRQSSKKGAWPTGLSSLEPRCNRPSPPPAPNIGGNRARFLFIASRSLPVNEKPHHLAFEESSLLPFLLFPFVSLFPFFQLRNFRLEHRNRYTVSDTVREASQVREFWTELTNFARDKSRSGTKWPRYDKPYTQCNFLRDENERGGDKYPSKITLTSYRIDVPRGLNASR